MARLAVVSTTSQADGFRLAGATTIVSRPGSEVAELLQGLVNEPDIGLVIVTSELWVSLDERLRGLLEQRPRPIVLAIPGGEVSEATTHRQLLAEMLQRAIGYRIELGRGDER